MVFWRSKIAKLTETRAETANVASSITEIAAVEADTTPENSDSEPVETGERAEASNVVALAANRLSDRLTMTAISRDHKDIADGAPTPLIATPRKGTTIGLSVGAKALKEALSQPLEDGHVLVIAPADGSRLPSIVESAANAAKEWPVPPAWIAAPVAPAGKTIPVFSVPRDVAYPLVANANQALKNAAGHLVRIAKSDDYKMSLDVLAEERVHASEQPLEHLKRRAEAQNIAVVKTLDGYVLAPMHDGRVVRQDVFRALPDTLQRDVEIKISVLETELKSLMTREPDLALATESKLQALFDSVAGQASRSAFARLRAQYSELAATEPFFSDLEQAFAERGRDWLLGGTANGFYAGRAFCLCADEEKIGDPAAPVVMARGTSAANLFGEIGRDAEGHVALSGGHLSAANGGFLVIEGWRLAADAQSWLALSAAVENGSFMPLRAPGLIAGVASIPLALRLVLVADEVSFTKLEALDPGIGKHFPTVVRLASRDDAV